MIPEGLVAANDAVQHLCMGLGVTELEVFPRHDVEEEPVHDWASSSMGIDCHGKQKGLLD